MKRFDVIIQLEDLAEWFENPNLSPMLFILLNGTNYAVSTVLRQIAQNLEAEEWNNGTLHHMRGSPAPEPRPDDNPLPRVGGVGYAAGLLDGTKLGRPASDPD